VKRLTHPATALVRVLQMSQADIIVFVEGWSDRFFYDQLTRATCGSGALNYQIRTAKEIGASGNGKPALIGLFRTFRQRGVLDGSKKRHASAFFFLDKDVDELQGSIVRSRHIGYTEHFNIENYFIIAGDLPRAVAVSASLELDALRAWFGDLDAWRRSIANQWRKWIELCLFACLDGVSCCCHFRSIPVHKSSGELDYTHYIRALRELKEASGLTGRAFKQRHKEIREIVKRYYSSGRHDAIFNGKWYHIFIQAAVKKYANGRAIKDRLSQSIHETLLSTVEFDGKWGDSLRRPLSRLLRHVEKFKA
jgi:hypothetical protein